jgi:cob(I)alamin adenosyltransferase
VKIYTKTGDAGETGHFDNTRVSKADARVDAYGEVDELNAWLGVVRASGLDADLDRVLQDVQRDLMAVGGRRAAPRAGFAARVDMAALDGAAVARLERVIDDLDGELPALSAFVLPAGAPMAAHLHVARAVCRRAERRVVGLAGPVDPVVIVYLNRLSDLLFTMARAVNGRMGTAETAW